MFMRNSGRLEQSGSCFQNPISFSYSFKSWDLLTIDSFCTSLWGRELFGHVRQLSVFTVCGLHELAPCTPWPTKSKIWFAANFQVYCLRTLTNQIFHLSQEKCTSSRTSDHNFRPHNFHSMAISPLPFVLSKAQAPERGSTQATVCANSWDKKTLVWTCVFQASTLPLRETSSHNQSMPTSTLSNSSELWLWAKTPPPVGGKRQALWRGTPRRNTKKAS